ncbi:MAG: hypothetical protein A2504_08120 [Bdellovibrionales bacterium RIFOXYD12_FULL_39_22]|nr:MAG: hypothetical protein A2385_13745 [Bdellovibrionales bacterium RIFOXYB1_FULL_39_21]OFZ44897.1 MAG: hypothetical protein A2485_14955 [Bdellovibrionales bacterium RIFOXYC12_FULL_39_17]OFZ49415.1 MAG: hypothetical protein A2404_09290 [Bdellovibrionales bacterium RIFOXYC1_FULL_39_130]OFZ77136.1 MAG: hypothetical protein A2560_10940 [Bdellovibrionales bacterium RIFOXYD1_FULL_39_84]OFZ95597.1 MAG: hypothetical protein A2504_08120 [Bdellovibrionales bacterium RIFOXYD12_FULL_39_22]
MAGECRGFVFYENSAEDVIATANIDISGSTWGSKTIPGDFAVAPVIGDSADQLTVTDNSFLRLFEFSGVADMFVWNINL